MHGLGLATIFTVLARFACCQRHFPRLAVHLTPPFTALAPASCCASQARLLTLLRVT